MSDARSGDNGATSARQPPRSLSLTLAGRVDELERLAATASRSPAVALIEGAAGIGKTRLLAELRMRPEGSRQNFFVGACRHIREPFPLGPIVEALRNLDPDLISAELSPEAGALRRLLPELSHLLPPQSVPPVDRDAERQRTFRGLRDLLGSLGETILALEDAHWVDEQTLEFLTYLLSDPPADLTVVLTFRAEDLPAGVRALTNSLPEPVTRVHLVLEPLGVADTGAMAATLLGTDKVSDDFALYLSEHTSGLPFAIQELLVSLQTRGALGNDGAIWSRKALAELNVPTETSAFVLERVARLSERGRAAAEAAATLQLPASLSTLVGTCPLSDEDALRGVDEALESGLLVEHHEILDFRHRLAAEAVYEAIPSTRRQQLHGRAATALEQLWPVPLGQVVHHRREAGETEAWAEAAEKAADQAARAGDEAEAARLLDELLHDGALDPDRRSRLALKLGRFALEATRPADLIAPLSEVLERDTELPPAVRGKLRFWLGLLLDQTEQDHARQHSLFAQAVDELDDQPALKASAMICLALGSPPVVTEQLTWVRRAATILPEVEDPAYEVYLQSKVGSVMVLAGDPLWRQAADRITAQTRGQPRQPHEVRAYNTVAGCACWAGHHDLAADWLTRALAASESLPDERLLLRLRSNLAVLDYFRGRWDGLRERVESYIDRFAERPRIRIDLDVVASRLALVEGDLDGAARRLDELTRGVDRLDAFDLLPLAIETHIRLALATGDTSAAMDAAERLLNAVQSVGIWLSTIRAIPAVVEAMVAAGRADEAGTLLAGLSQKLPELDAPLAPAALEHAHGVLAAGERRWETAVGHLQTATSRYQGLGCRYEAAQAQEQTAQAQLVAAPPEAEELLRAAAATYRDLGARWDLDRTADIARQHGISLLARQRSGRRGYGSDLSPREREVAELAAAHSNREIADKLAVSVNTVKKHLSAAMRKLGVRSRAELPRRLGAAT